MASRAPRVRWTTRQAVVSHGSGRDVALIAEVSEPITPREPITVVGAAFAIALLLTGIVFPPCLLLNVPLLLARSAFNQALWASFERLKLPAFPCPVCGADQEPTEHPGTLPAQVRCLACDAELDVRQLRRNLARAAAPAAPPEPG